MSDLHDLCRFEDRPVGPKYIEQLKYYLKSGIPATYTIEEAYAYINNIEEEACTTTTPLHLICTNLPQDCQESELEIIDSMVQILLEYGAGWCLTDVNNETPGCILIRKKMADNSIYKQILQAGVRAELLLRKVSEFDMEVIEDTDDLDHRTFETLAEEGIPQLVTGEGENDTDKKSVEYKIEEPKVEIKAEKNLSSEEKNFKIDDDTNDPSGNQELYLKTKLEYTDDALVTKDGKDGVMMSWETDLMQLGCDSMFKESEKEQSEMTQEIIILNIGFGMGIIDGMISKRNPTKQYICEAHPDVLVKLRQDGWYDKPNVVILEGRWQDQLNKLLSDGNVFFDGIYYDTFSEHYEDMLELFDYVVGLLKPQGLFSFFNGLGADRQVVYEVYKQLVEIDLSNYGLACTFTEIQVPESMLKKDSHEESAESVDSSVWDGIKRPYWTCPVYYHPEARFMDV